MNMQAQTDQNTAVPDFSDWETIRGLSKLSNGKLTETQIRWQLRFRDQNGLDKAVVKVGKTIYIHVPTYMRVSFHR
jgi:hypothetical protein